jgi:hypothetical protein
MLSAKWQVVCAKCLKIELYAACHYAEYCYAVCLYAECRGVVFYSFFLVLVGYKYCQLMIKS